MAYYWGDSHGNFQYMKHELKSKKKANHIHVGDFGLIQTDVSLAKKILEDLNAVLRKKDSFMYVNRGNHDNPKYWNSAEIMNLSNIRLMKDYEIANIEGKMTLFLGGAVSIDRTELVKARFTKWWANEKFVYDEEKILQIIETQHQIDVVVSHTAPNFSYPMGFNNFVLDWAKDDPSLLADIAEERGNLSRVYQLLTTKFKIKRWVYGHFHFPNTMHYNGTEFTIIAQNTYSINQY